MSVVGQAKFGKVNRVAYKGFNHSLFLPIERVNIKVFTAHTGIGRGTMYKAPSRSDFFCFNYRHCLMDSGVNESDIVAARVETRDDAVNALDRHIT